MRSPNPAIDGAAIVKGFDSNQAIALQHDADQAQALLDEADLPEMDQADYYGGAATTETPAPEPRRSLLDRLFRRQRDGDQRSRSPAPLARAVGGLSGSKRQSATSRTGS